MCTRLSEHPGYAATAAMVSESAIILACQRDQLSGRRGVLTPVAAMAMHSWRLPAAGVTITPPVCLTNLWVRHVEASDSCICAAQECVGCLQPDITGPRASGIDAAIGPSPPEPGCHNHFHPIADGTCPTGNRRERSDRGSMFTLRAGFATRRCPGCRLRDSRCHQPVFGHRTGQVQPHMLVEVVGSLGEHTLATARHSPVVIALGHTRSVLRRSTRRFVADRVRPLLGP